MELFINGFLSLIALPTVGLSTLFVISLISATFVPMGSEPALFAYIKLYPDLFWPAIFVATAGNVTGGMIDWWMGYGAKLAVFRLRRAKKYRPKPYKYNRRLLIWCRRYGPPMLLLSWLPIIGDPLCIVAGWLRLPWRGCLLYMTIGKFLRYTTTTLLLLWVPNRFWQQLWTQLF